MNKQSTEIIRSQKPPNTHIPFHSNNRNNPNKQSILFRLRSDGASLSDWLSAVSAIMRFTKGCKVEVFSKREVATGSWLPAEIINGDGHNYTVNYDKFANEPVIGWVSPEAIRPRPPLENANWSSGEIVEVLDNFSWKIGTILKGLGQKKILVQLHGSLVNRIVNLNDIRVRYSWEDGKWIVMGKRFLKSENGKYCDMGNDLTHKLKCSSPYLPTEWEYSAEASRKYRHIGKEGQTYRYATADLSGDGEHAYRMPSQCVITGRKRGQSSLVIRFPVRQQRSASSQSVDSFSSVRSDSNDDDGDLCSIGSCSTTDSWNQSVGYGPTADSTGDHSDAESSCAPSHNKEYITLESLEKAAAAAIHQFELQGYRCTLRALHASGPLSWEQQSLISNLRLSLNISNDEHLMELKSLLSR